ncbi:hypothetical protein AAFF_G00111110 [Aldrovandia affinis]|uniref:Uncharacterized protein n=1 Tax=Aldrovandia affinis TaxID=143900 RepID=A0AAD7RTS6_9TELE|nr:hypothetical protein AAFF_G00111110 [Aldrovandia affinis]
MTNGQSQKAVGRSGSGASSAFHYRPSSPIQLLSMMCCPDVAEAYGHELLQQPAQCAHLSPLSSAWWTVKWFISNSREKYSEEMYDRGTLYRHIFYTDLIDDSLKSMTKRKWKDLVSRVRKTEDFFLK